jgi:Protein of unknown function (DUF2934)
MADTAELDETQSVGERSDARSEERHRRIAEAAYYRAERRGFTPGDEEEDWIAAEREIDGGGEAFHAEDNYFPSPK